MKQEHTYIPFTEEMKKDYTILVPNMLPMHIKLIIQVLQNEGYDKIELLESDGPEIAETGLKYTHNDTCYPAILVIGQFIHAIQSGKYDPEQAVGAEPPIIFISSARPWPRQVTAMFPLFP